MTTRQWTLTIEGEGEHPESISGAETETKAIQWAEDLIEAGDYDLEDGETMRIRYHLRLGVMQLDRHVDLDG